MSINGVNSDHKYVKCGVPQGSTLGPLLFLIYIEDILNSSSKIKYILNAGDTTLLYNDLNVDNMIQYMTNEHRKIIFWFNTNKLCLKASKSTLIALHTKQKISRPFGIPCHLTKYASIKVLLILHSILILPYLTYYY